MCGIVYWIILVWYEVVDVELVYFMLLVMFCLFFIMGGVWR